MQFCLPFSKDNEFKEKVYLLIINKKREGCIKKKERKGILQRLQNVKTNIVMELDRVGIKKITSTSRQTEIEKKIIYMPE